MDISSVEIMVEEVWSGIYIFILVIIVIVAAALSGMYKMFEKAGQPGFGAIIPFYNIWCMCDMVFHNGRLFFFSLVPFVNIVFGIILQFKMAAVFGKGNAFGFGLVFLPPVFYCILGFGSAVYIEE